MKFKVLTLNPGFYGPLTEDGVFSRGLKQGLLGLEVRSLRDYAGREDRRVDDRPFGGGEGMVIRPDVTKRAVEGFRTPDTKVVFLAPSGSVFDSQVAKTLASASEILFVSGRYEGFDARALSSLADSVLSAGDFVLSSGDPAAIMMMDAVARFVPGVLGNPQSCAQDSFEDGFLEAPCYTRPEYFDGKPVPKVLLSGDHGRIQAFRRREQIRITALQRPDLIFSAWETLTPEEVTYVRRIWKAGKKFRVSQETDQ